MFRRPQVVTLCVSDQKTSLGGDVCVPLGCAPCRCKSRLRSMRLDRLHEAALTGDAAWSRATARPDVVSLCAGHAVPRCWASPAPLCRLPPRA